MLCVSWVTVHYRHRIGVIFRRLSLFKSENGGPLINTLCTLNLQPWLCVLVQEPIFDWELSMGRSPLGSKPYRGVESVSKRHIAIYIVSTETRTRHRSTGSLRRAKLGAVLSKNPVGLPVSLDWSGSSGHCVAAHIWVSAQGANCRKQSSDGRRSLSCGGPLTPRGAFWHPSCKMTWEKHWNLSAQPRPPLASWSYTRLWAWPYTSTQSCSDQEVVFLRSSRPWDAIVLANHLLFPPEVCHDFAV